MDKISSLSAAKPDELDRHLQLQPSDLQNSRKKRTVQTAQTNVRHDSMNANAAPISGAQYSIQVSAAQKQKQQ